MSVHSSHASDGMVVGLVASQHKVATNVSSRETQQTLCEAYVKKLLHPACLRTPLKQTCASCCAVQGEYGAPDEACQHPREVHGERAGP